MAKESDADNGNTVTPLGVDTNGHRVPVPDPTKLTTDALDKAIDKLREEMKSTKEDLASFVTSKDEHVREKFELFDKQVTARLSGVGEAAESDRSRLQELMEEKFSAVVQRFELLEQQRLEQKSDTKAAVDAALTAQKEAVKEQTTASSLATQKSETATLKQLEQQATAFGTEAQALRRQIDELKERIGETDRNSRAGTSDLDRSLRAAISEVAQTAAAYGQQKIGSTDTKQGLYIVMGLAVAVASFFAGRGGP